MRHSALREGATRLRRLFRRVGKGLSARHMIVGLAIAFTAVLGGAVVSWMADSGHLMGDRWVEATPKQVQDGELVYATTCAACHGDARTAPPGWRPTLGGVAPPPRSADRTALGSTDRYLVSIIRDGSAAVHADPTRNRMPPFRDVLSNREVHAVVAYLKTRWPDQVADIGAELED